MNRLHILVTGCAGFVGSHLCRKLLHEEHRVLGIDDVSCGFYENMEDFELNDFFTFCELDVRKYDSLKHYIEMQGEYFDLIVHLAARGELYFCNSNPTEAVDVNVSGTINMLRLIKDLNLRTKHFVFADTSAEYDNVPEFEDDSKMYRNYPVSEDVFSLKYPDYLPLGIYSISKMAASQYVRSYCKKYGIGSTILRYFNICGPAQNINREIPPVMGAFAQKMLKNEQPIFYGDVQNKRRDFIHIDDVIDLHMKVIELRLNKTDSQTYNVGTGINYTIFQIYELVSEYIFGENKTKWMYPICMPEAVSDTKITLADIFYTKRELNWEPKRNIHDMVKDTVESIRRK